VIVRVVSAGICHTDLVPREQAIPAPFPAVYGHEGAGVADRQRRPEYPRLKSHRSFLHYTRAAHIPLLFVLQIADRCAAAGTMSHTSLVRVRRHGTLCIAARAHDKYIAAAIEGRAGLVVAGDSDLADLKQDGDIRIVSPRVFLDLLVA